MNDWEMYFTSFRRRYKLRGPMSFLLMLEIFDAYCDWKKERAA